MLQLSNFIRWKNDFWNKNILVPLKWFEYFELMKNMKYDKMKDFKAENAEEYKEHVKKYLPYLNDEDILKLYDIILEKRYISIAAPPFLNEKYFHQIITGKNKSEKFILFCECSQTSIKDYDTLYFKDQALTYAKQNWSEILVADLPFYKANYVFRDPADIKYGFGIIDTRYSIKVGFDESYDDLDFTTAKEELIGKKIYQKINDHVVMLTHHSLLFNEFIAPDKFRTGKQYPEAEPSPICVYDGSTLTADKCLVCKREFPKSSAYMFRRIPICDSLFSYIKDYENQIRSHFNIDDKFVVVPDENLLNQARSNE